MTDPHDMTPRPAAEPTAEPAALPAGADAGADASAAAAGSDPAEFGRFDEFVETLGRWAGSLPEWPPAAAVHAEWTGIEPRLDRARRELSRVLVVGVVGGTGTGKSTLVNALAGGDVTAAGDVARPTTINPVVIAAADLDLDWLPLDAMQARVVRSHAAAVAHVVFVDCPDPDTQADMRDPRAAAAPENNGGGPRPSATNRNRDLLEQVLPACDVLLLVATAQKYRSWIVAREVAAFAPGRPLFFVQTHAARDPDIRDDWRRELEAQGFSVPRIFRLDGVEAFAWATTGGQHVGRGRAAAGEHGGREAPPEGFAELLAAIDEELVGRAARRVRRTGAIDLAAWFTRQCTARLGPLATASADLAAGIDRERARLEGLLATAISKKLRGDRDGWQRLVADEIVADWRGGPFAVFLRGVAAVPSLWGRVQPGGLVGRLVAGSLGGRTAAATPAGWQTVEDLGLPESEVEQSRSVLAGLAARARLGDTLVGRGRLDDARVESLAATVLDRGGRWLATGVERIVADRRGRWGGSLLHWACELVFAGLLATILGRAAWNFFYGQLWAGRPVDGGGFLLQGLVWLVLTGFALRWLVFRVVRSGLDRDVSALVAGLPQARLVDPLVADYREAVAQVDCYLLAGRRLAAEAEEFVAALEASGSALGRYAVTRGSPGSGG